MKLLSEHRCPWCGEVTERIKGPRGRLNIKKCKSCGKEYICHYNSNIFFLTDFLLVILLITTAMAMTHVVFPAIYLIFYLSVNIFMSRISAYERYETDEETETEEHKARLAFDIKNPNALEEMKMTIYTMEKAIIPVRFTDGAGTPVSEKMYICVERSVRRKRTEYECDFSLLPLSHEKYIIESDSCFCFYDGEDKAIGKGNIVLKYERLA